MSLRLAINEDLFMREVINLADTTTATLRELEQRADATSFELKCSVRTAGEADDLCLRLLDVIEKNHRFVSIVILNLGKMVTNPSGSGSGRLGYDVFPLSDDLLTALSKNQILVNAVEGRDSDPFMACYFDQATKKSEVQALLDGEFSEIGTLVGTAHQRKVDMQRFLELIQPRALDAMVHGYLLGDAAFPQKIANLFAFAQEVQTVLLRVFVVDPRVLLHHQLSAKSPDTAATIKWLRGLRNGEAVPKNAIAKAVIAQLGLDRRLIPSTDTSSDSAAASAAASATTEDAAAEAEVISFTFAEQHAVALMCGAHFLGDDTFGETALELPWLALAEDNIDADPTRRQNFLHCLIRSPALSFVYVTTRQTHIVPELTSALSGRVMPMNVALLSHQAFSPADLDSMREVGAHVLFSSLTGDDDRAHARRLVDLMQVVRLCVDRKNFDVAKFVDVCTQANRAMEPFSENEKQVAIFGRFAAAIVQGVLAKFVDDLPQLVNIAPQGLGIFGAALIDVLSSSITGDPDSSQASVAMTWGIIQYNLLKLEDTDAQTQWDNVLQSFCQIPDADAENLAPALREKYWQFAVLRSIRGLLQLQGKAEGTLWDLVKPFAEYSDDNIKNAPEAFAQMRAINSPLIEFIEFLDALADDNKHQFLWIHLLQRVFGASKSTAEMPMQDTSPIALLFSDTDSEQAASARVIVIQELLKSRADLRAVNKNTPRVAIMRMLNAVLEYELAAEEQVIFECDYMPAMQKALTVWVTKQKSDSYANLTRAVLRLDMQSPQQKQFYAQALPQALLDAGVPAAVALLIITSVQRKHNLDIDPEVYNALLSKASSVGLGGEVQITADTDPAEKAFYLKLALLRGMHEVLDRFAAKPAATADASASAGDTTAAAAPSSSAPASAMYKSSASAASDPVERLQRQLSQFEGPRFFEKSGNVERVEGFIDGFSFVSPEQYTHDKVGVVAPAVQAFVGLVQDVDAVCERICPAPAAAVATAT